MTCTLKQISDDLLTPDEVVEALGGIVTKKTLSNWRTMPDRQTELQFVRLGGRIYYWREDVELFLKARKYRTTKEYASPHDTENEPVERLRDEGKARSDASPRRNRGVRDVPETQLRNTNIRRKKTTCNVPLHTQ